MRPPGHRAPVVLQASAAALAIGVLGLLLAPAGVLPAPAARAASTDLVLVTSARYTVDPAKGRIHVTVDVTAANHRADTRVNRFYYDHAFLAVQPGAVSPRMVKGASGSGARVWSHSTDATILRLDFGARLYGGHTTTFQFAFDLVDTGTGTRRLIRVGTSLTTFPVWAYASDGASGSRVSVRFPKGYDVTVESGSFASRGKASDGGVVLSTGALANPLGFFAYVSAQEPATYRSTKLSVKIGGTKVALTMRAWKDDKTWAGRVGDLFARALPVLRKDIGLAWPHDGPVVVQEAVSRSTGGFAGVYDPQEGQIQVAYWASSSVVVHEAAHGWFNGSLLADRWAAEGFASLYAQRALKSLKIKATLPALTAALKKSAFPLNAWPATPDPAAASESYGYAASAALAGLIAKRAGMDALSRVWADAAAGIGAYQPPAGQASAPETVDGPPDWRGLLDLLEAETGTSFTDLWRRWVVRPGEADLLDQRALARTAYRNALAAADGWALPRSIRDALRAWQFDTATSLLASARLALAQRVTLVAQARAAGVTLPNAIQARFESGDFAGAVAEVQREQTAIAAITAAAADRASTAGDPLTAVGMIGSHPEQELAAAETALATGDTASAVAAANAATSVWSGARDEGRRRLLMGGSLLAAVGVLGASLASRLRRSRRSSAAVVTL